MDALSALDKLRISLQNAATMCRPAAVTSAIAKEESFDSADMEEEDPHEGVGVDERAASLDPEDFLLDDDELWYSSARWVLGRDETISFIADALISHLAPLYVPYAPNSAITPAEVVPRDVQRDILGLAEDFVSEHNLTSLSVLDVKEGISAALGDRGATFLPHEYPICGEEESQESQLAIFSSKFVDTEEGWAALYSTFRPTDDEDDDEDEDDDNDGDDEDSDGEEVLWQADHEDSTTSMPDTEATNASFTAGPDEALNSSVWEEDGQEVAVSPTKAPSPLVLLPHGISPGDLRQVILSCVAEGSGRTALPRCAEPVMDALSLRLANRRNARNSLVLLARLTSSRPPSHGVPLAADQVSQMLISILLTGPLRSLRLATEDPPPAAIAATDLLAQRLCGEEGGGGGGRRVIGTAGDVLEAARDDQDLCLACTGWCLKFLFEGEAMEDTGRRYAAFAQAACEISLGPLHGVTLAGPEEWHWSDKKAPDPSLIEHATNYAKTFSLAHGDSLASILRSFRKSLSAAGFPVVDVDEEDDTIQPKQRQHQQQHKQHQHHQHHQQQEESQTSRDQSSQSLQQESIRPARPTALADSKARMQVGSDSQAPGSRGKQRGDDDDIPVFRELPQMIVCPPKPKQERVEEGGGGGGGGGGAAQQRVMDGGEEAGNENVPVFGALPVLPPSAAASSQQAK